jgi:hypothetical protein
MEHLQSFITRNYEVNKLTATAFRNNQFILTLTNKGYSQKTILEATATATY